MLAFFLGGLPFAAQAQWKPVETVKTYAVAGTSGPELYASIGERGPTTGGTQRAIAHTSFKLTWQRDYDRSDGNCTLRAARPKLVVIYTLPKPAQPMPAGTQRAWDQFMSGIRTHERVHGTMIEAMVRKIETVTVGMSVANDPECKKFAVELRTKLKALSDEQRARGREFDRAEMRDGGNVQQLVLALVNGG